MMEGLGSHYSFLGIDSSASRATVSAAVERLEAEAAARVTWDTQGSYEMRERLLRIREDLLSSEQRRQSYDRWLAQAQAKHEGVTIERQPRSEVVRHVASGGYGAVAASGGKNGGKAKRVRPVALLAIAVAMLAALAGATGAIAFNSLTDRAKPATPGRTSTPSSTATTDTRPIVEAVGLYRRSQWAAYGPTYNFTIASRFSVGEALKAVICQSHLFRSIPKYNTYSDFKVRGTKVTVTGASATVSQTISETSSSHYPKNPPGQQLVGQGYLFNALYSVERTGGGWRVFDYTYVTDGVPYRAVQDTRTCHT
jgi:hypothetical protein